MIKTDTKFRQSIDDDSGLSVEQNRCIASVCEVAEIDAMMIQKPGFAPSGQGAFPGRAVSTSKQAGF